jgi:hypothetical protein
MTGELSALAAALHAARHFEQAARATLRTLLRMAAHLCVLPLRLPGGRIDGMISLARHHREKYPEGVARLAAEAERTTRRP